MMRNLRTFGASATLAAVLVALGTTSASAVSTGTNDSAPTTEFPGVSQADPTEPTLPLSQWTGAVEEYEQYLHDTYGEIEDDGAVFPIAEGEIIDGSGNEKDEPEAWAEQSETAGPGDTAEAPQPPVLEEPGDLAPPGAGTEVGNGTATREEEGRGDVASRTDGFPRATLASTPPTLRASSTGVRAGPSAHLSQNSPSTEETGRTKRHTSAGGPRVRITGTAPASWDSPDAGGNTVVVSAYDAAAPLSSAPASGTAVRASALTALTIVLATVGAAVLVCGGSRRNEI